MLSVQTPWGLVRPLYMPEGVSPASGILQTMMRDIFLPYDEWSIVIFDNILLLARDYTDAFDKLNTILKCAAEHSLVLKFKKSWVGFTEVTFFGYVVTQGTYRLSDDRKAAIAAIPFPKIVKGMQRFLGAALFFSSFIPNYSTLTSPLYDMTKETFPWTNPKEWTQDYQVFFDDFKEALSASCTICFPNYGWNWVLRVDASEVAVGAALFQCNPDGPLEPLGFKSRKFSAQASRWDMYKKEAFAVYEGVRSFSYYLRGKDFVLETDHRNLLWIERSTVPIVIRWRVYLQSYSFMMRHIKGKDNTVADFLSRMYCLDPTPVNDLHTSIAMVVSIPDVPQPPEYYLEQVHGGRALHMGFKRTWEALNKFFPGHTITQQCVRDFVATCPICQKDRIGMTSGIQPIVRNLRPPHHRSRVGIDRVTITPADEAGNTNCLVVVDLFTKYTALYPAKDYTALTAAQALFTYFCTFGLYDDIISDPGSDFMSDMVSQLNEWLGVHHTVSLVDRHESNGVEAHNREILRHLSALIHDYRVIHKWSDPSVLLLIAYTLNAYTSSETGVSPFQARPSSAVWTLLIANSL